ncbi:MAG: hypothetical protein IJ877_03710 [Candidatus Gastranaerophilales bacterium]|nr:hypothetical protein [Candidatus Gastranaerophilales bacterium]
MNILAISPVNFINFKKNNATPSFGARTIYPNKDTFEKRTILQRDEAKMAAQRPREDLLNSWNVKKPEVKEKIRQLQGEQFDHVMWLVQNGMDPMYASQMATLDTRQIERAYKLLDAGIPDSWAAEFAGLDDSRYEKSIQLLRRGVPAYDASALVIKTMEKDYPMVLRLIENNIRPQNIYHLMESPSDYLPNAVINFANKGVDDNDAINIIEKNSVEASYKGYIAKGYNPQLAGTLANISNMTEDKEDNVAQILVKFSNFPPDEKKANSEVLTRYIRKHRNDFNEFSEYIQDFDLDSILPYIPDSFSFKNIMAMVDYHYRHKTEEFNEDTLSFPEDMVKFLSDNYVDADNLEELLSAFPATNRNIGSLPEGWVNSALNKDEIKENIYNAIDRFKHEGKIEDFEEELSYLLNKDVQVTKLGAGCYGTGYKISMEGCEDICLKIFYNSKLARTDKINDHGQFVEPQMALFANNHSDKYVKFYFGRLGGINTQDGFMVCQYLDRHVPIIPTNPKDTDIYDIHTEDTLDGYNMIQGIIYDFGTTRINDSEGYPVRWFMN